MFKIETYLAALTAALQQAFGPQLVYVGLQGSYLRGEATPHSDIDIMLVLEEVDMPAMDTYKRVLANLGQAHRACGFICTRAQLAAWNPLEICHLLHSTQDVYGTLAHLTPPYTPQDVLNFIKLSLNNLHHALTHRYIHGGEGAYAAHLAGDYKAAFFILQNLHHLRTGHFAATRRELLPLLGPADARVLRTAMALQSGLANDTADAYARLLAWCDETLRTL